MIEIGSEFWELPMKAEPDPALFPADTKWYLSGRAALNAILGDILAKRTCRTAALPSWCCDSMIKPFADHGLDIRFYPVYRDESGRLVQSLHEAEDCDLALVLDYFGFHTEQDTSALRGIVIRDLTHAFFSGIPEDADYYFGSTRKWTGIWSGGYAWAKDGILPDAKPVNELHPYIAARKAAMLQKKKYIEHPEGNDKEFLKLFGYAEEWLDENTELFGAAGRDISAIRSLDTDLIRRKRRENAAFLLEKLGQYSFVQTLGERDCPLFVPVFLDPVLRSALRKHLIGKQIYCPVHWPVSEYHRLTPQTQTLYDTELSIICDQRYDLSDMQRICDEIVSFITSYKGA